MDEAIPQRGPASYTRGCVRVRRQRHRSDRCQCRRGSDFASLLVGMGTQPGTETNQGSYPSFTKDIFAAESNPYYAAFAEDTFHASKSLTITAGLRWDIFGGRNERSNRQEYFNPNIKQYR